jgi:BirA family biotin operon repressor/biotin-[acetyl-CoA-carboxylase] ligase
LKSSHSDDHRSLPGAFERAIDRVRPRLGPIASVIYFFRTIDSTNTFAASLTTEGAVVIADEQNAGRGRRGHTWFSPAGSGLYVSVVAAPGRARLDPARATMLLTIAIGVALTEGIEASTGLKPELKWPNDVYAGRRKLAGVLAESSGDDLVVVGYGINVGASAFPPELADRATSLETELGHAADRATVLAETLAAVATRYDDLLAARYDAILDAWRLRSPLAIGAHVSWPSATGTARGVTAGIDRDGALLVHMGDRIERIVSGELCWPLP